MMRSNRLPWAAIIVALSASLVSAGAIAQTRPNVIFIMTDDLGYGDIGVYGGNDIATPRLDRLARDQPPESADPLPAPGRGGRLKTALVCIVAGTLLMAGLLVFIFKDVQSI